MADYTLDRTDYAREGADYTLEGVDFDPFATEAGSGPGYTLERVEHDPFADEAPTIAGHAREIGVGVPRGVGTGAGMALQGASALEGPWWPRYGELLGAVESVEIDGSLPPLDRFGQRPSPRAREPIGPDRDAAIAEAGAALESARSRLRAFDNKPGGHPRKRRRERAPLRRALSEAEAAMETARALPVREPVAPPGALASLDESIRTDMDLPPRLKQALRQGLRRRAAGEDDPLAAARSLMPAPLTERPLWRAGEAVTEAATEAFPRAPGYEDALSGTVGEGLGSLALGVGVGLASGPASPVTLSTLFGSMGAGEAAERARQAGAPPEQVAEATRLGVLAGGTDVLPVEILLRRVPAPARRAIEETAARVGATDVVRAAGRVGVQGLVESVQEGGQQALQNLIAREVYAPDQPIVEGVAPGAGVGGIVGAIAGLGREGVLAVGRRRSTASRGDRARAAREVPPPSPEDEASPLPTEDIHEGRVAVADAMASERVSRSLENANMAPVGQPVRMNDGAGQVVEGVVTDAETGEDGAVRSVAVTVSDDRFGGPVELEFTMPELTARGISIEGVPLPEAVDPEIRASLPGRGGEGGLDVSLPARGGEGGLAARMAPRGGEGGLNAALPKLAMDPTLSVKLPELAADPFFMMHMETFAARPELSVMMPRWNADPDLRVTMERLAGDPELRAVMPQLASDPELRASLPNMAAEVAMRAQMPGPGGEGGLTASMPRTAAPVGLDARLPPSEAPVRLEAAMPPRGARPEIDARMPPLGARPELQARMPDTAAPVRMEASLPGRGGAGGLDVSMPPRGARPELDASLPDTAAPVVLDVALPDMADSDPRLRAVLPRLGAEPQLRAILPRMGAEMGLDVRMPGRGAQPEMDVSLPDLISDPELRASLPALMSDPGFRASLPRLGAELGLDIAMPGRGGEGGLEGVTLPLGAEGGLDVSAPRFAADPSGLSRMPYPPPGTRIPVERDMRGPEESANEYLSEPIGQPEIDRPPVHGVDEQTRRTVRDTRGPEEPTVGAPPVAPERAFHGTRSDFADFDATFGVDDGGGQVFFTSDRETADVFGQEAVGPLAQPRLLERDIDTARFDVVDAQGQRYGALDSPERALAQAKREGKDGVIFRNVENDFARYDEAGEARGMLPNHDIYAVFKTSALTAPTDFPPATGTDEQQRRTVRDTRQPEEVAPALAMRADGTPFKTEKAARLAARNRGDQDAIAVEVAGGWAYRAQAPEEAVSATEQGPPPPETPVDRANRETAAEVTRAETDVDTEPTEAQKEAGNYRKGHVRVQGLDISIENPAGTERRGVGPDGKPWSVVMPATYGYVRGSKGADGDQVDVYIGPAPESGTVYVVDQQDADTREFDEHKVMLGYRSQDEALADYDRAFDDGRGPERRRTVTPMSVASFRQWLGEGETRQPVAEPIVRKNGQPFATEKSAALAARARRIEAIPVEIEGGFALQRAPESPITEPDTVDETPLAEPAIQRGPDGPEESSSAIEVIHATDDVANPAMVGRGDDDLLHVSTQTLTGAGEGLTDFSQKRYQHRYRMALRPEEVFDAPDLGTWEAGDIANAAEDAGIFDESEMDDIWDGKPDREDVLSRLRDKGIKAIRYENAFEGSGDETTSYALLDSDPLVPVDETQLQRADAPPAAPQPAPQVRIRLARRFAAEQPKVAGDIDRIGRRVFGDAFSVRVAESIRAPEGGEATGAYDPANRIAYIALRSQEGMTASLYHEGIHHLRNMGAFRDAQGNDTAPWRTLEREAAKWRRDYDIDARYGADPGIDEAMLNEEAIAEALADFATRGQATGFGPTVRSALARVLRFFRSVANGLRGRGFDTPESILEGIGRGEFAQRATEPQSRADEDAMLQRAGGTRKPIDWFPEGLSLVAEERLSDGTLLTAVLQGESATKPAGAREWQPVGWRMLRWTTGEGSVAEDAPGASVNRRPADSAFSAQEAFGVLGAMLRGLVDQGHRGDIKFDAEPKRARIYRRMVNAFGWQVKDVEAAKGEGGTDRFRIAPAPDTVVENSLLQRRRGRSAPVAARQPANRDGQRRLSVTGERQAELATIREAAPDTRPDRRRTTESIARKPWAAPVRKALTVAAATTRARLGADTTPPPAEVARDAVRPVTDIAQAAKGAVPTVGAKHAGVGIKRANKAILSRIRGVPNADWRALEAAGVVTAPTIARGERNAFRGSGELASAPMSAFVAASEFPAAVVYLGARSQAQERGLSKRETERHVRDKTDAAALLFAGTTAPASVQRFTERQVARVSYRPRAGLGQWLVALYLAAASAGIPASDLDLLDMAAQWLTSGRTGERISPRKALEVAQMRARRAKRRTEERAAA